MNKALALASIQVGVVMIWGVDETRLPCAADFGYLTILKVDSPGLQVSAIMNLPPYPAFLLNI